MDKTTSIYLDACRFSAALMVFFHHLFAQPFFDGNYHFPFGRQAVVMFFVISGFVIAYVSDEKEHSLRDYTLSRLARLYSVVIPALVLAWSLDQFTFLLAPGLLDANTHSWAPVRFISSLLFINHSWSFTIAAFSNGPFWSLCYEFWYYVIFGAYLFAPKNWRLPVIVLAVIIAGPRIMLLFPLWLLGVATYWFSKRADDIPGAKLIFVCAFIWFVVLLFGYMNPLAELTTSFRSSLDANYLSITPSIRIFIGSDAGFLSDYVLGIAFATTVATSKYALSPLLKLPGLVKGIRFSSSYTFSLYLFHAPLLYFFVAISRHLELTEPLRGALLTLAVFLGAYALGGFTEHKKAAVHRVFSSFFDRISAKFRFAAS